MKSRRKKQEHEKSAPQRPIEPRAVKELESADRIARSTRSDIYLGVVAPVGVRRDSFHAAVENAMLRFGYEVVWIRLSELMSDFRDAKIDSSSEEKRLRSAMDAGSRLRETIGADALARMALAEVSLRRGERRISPRPVAYVFWSLKHPEEVALLRWVYGGAFHLIGLFASEQERIQELQRKPGMRRSEAIELVERDREEDGKKRGQQTRDSFHRADAFLHWGADEDAKGLDRFLDAVFVNPALSPTKDEHSMFLAYASATRSGELSRQVGAALVSAEGDVVALGANDVPRHGGGLYWPGEDDDRDSIRGQDSNVKTRSELLESVAKELQVENPRELADRLERTRLRRITEYGRAVHAEMEALMSCARSGISTRGGTLYVTTYPCHNCARHIIAAGIRRIVYVEPYPKSRALDLHGKDLVEVPPGTPSEDGRVTFEPFLGIGARRFFDYFSMQLGGGYALERMDQAGRLLDWDPLSAAPRGQLPLERVEDRENALSADVQVALVAKTKRKR